MHVLPEIKIESEVSHLTEHPFSNEELALLFEVANQSLKNPLFFTKMVKHLEIPRAEVHKVWSKSLSYMNK